MLSTSHLFTRDSSVFDYTFRGPHGTPCKGDRQIRHPLFNGDNDETTGYDVVLIRTRGPMNGGGPAPLLYGGTHEQGAPVVMVGYGARGIGSIGQNDTYDGPSGSKAAATNVVHEPMDLVQTPAGWAIVGVNANGGDQYDDYSFFARVSGLRPWLTSHMPRVRLGG